MTTSHDKRMLDREAVRSVIQQWNANRIDLFALSEPDENLLFHGVMRFYFQDAGQKVATKCIRVASDATVSDVIETLIEKFRPDMRMLSVPNYALYEVHANGEERRLNPDEKPLLVQLNWHIDDREGRFLLKNVDQKCNTFENADNNFKRKLSKREKKEQKKKEKLSKLNSDGGSMSGSAGGGGIVGDGENHVAEKLYTELPETSFTRSISNPEAVMRRRRQQKLEKKLQQFRSKDGGPDTGGTLKIYGESLCRDVPYKTLLLSIRDCAQAVVREMLSKYGLEKADPLHYCLVQVNSDGTEYILDDDECPLSILMNHPTSRGSIMFHVRRRPADSQPRRRKKKPLGVSNGTNNISNERDGPMLVEVTHSGDGGRRIKLGSEPIEVGSANSNFLQLYGPSIQPKHCVISFSDGICTVTPLHVDALTFVNGHHITQPTVLHNGSVVMFGRVASYRFIDSPSDGRYNLALSQSQLDSACLYESRSPASPSWNDDDRALSPVSSLATAAVVAAAQAQTHHLTNKQSGSYLDSCDSVSQQNVKTDFEKLHQTAGGGGGGSGSVSVMMTDDHQQQHTTSTPVSDDKSQKQNTAATGGGVIGTRQQQPQPQETDFAYDPEGTSTIISGGGGNGNNLENETKSISSYKSGGSNQDSNRKVPGGGGGGTSVGGDIQGQEPILPAVLEFPETHQEAFLRHVITELDVNAPNFKLAPVYTLYLCARYRASTHYRPELQPTERAHKLTIFLHHVANLIYGVIQEQYTDPRYLAFWLANSSEFLKFLKSDRHISAFSVQAQEVLAESVQTAFENLINCFRAELSQTLNQFLSENIDHDSAAGLVLTVLGSAMALLRRCRVNATLTIQLFSELFHYINAICFNTIISNSHMCTEEWGKVMSERLLLLEQWAERQGLELAADSHLAKISQCAQFLQASKKSVEEIQQLACSCYRISSLQTAALLQAESIPRNLIDTAIRMAVSVADELIKADGKEVRLEEFLELNLPLQLPDDGFSCDVVRGIPSGLVDFLSPLEAAGMCRLAAQPTSIGLWTVYLHQLNARSSSAMSNKLSQPEIQIIKLHKNSSGMGLSIIAAKGTGQERLGIYIKSVVPGGAADADGRLQAGDQLLRVDGKSLIGITQERAADYLVRTGPIVTLEVAKQGAIHHGLASLLQQPSPIIPRGSRRTLDRDGKTSITGTVNATNQYLSNSKSVPALHHVGAGGGSGASGTNIRMAAAKSRSIHNLANSNNEQGFYQNLSVYRTQNQSQPTLTDRSQIASQTAINSIGGGNMTSSTNQSVLTRPVSAYYNNSPSTAAMPSPNSYLMSQPGNNVNPPNVSSSNGSLLQTNHLHHQQQQHQQQQQSLYPGAGIGNQKSKNFARESQIQHSLRMNQMMAPSMPNIAHSSGYASNISASQSMQNVNMIASNQLDMNQQHGVGGHMLQANHGHIGGSTGEILHGHQRIHNPSAAAQLRGQAKLAEMGEFVARRHQRQEIAGLHGIDSQAPVNNGPPLVHPNHSAMGNFSKQNVPMHSPILQVSPSKQLPPTAPKPQTSRNQLSYTHQNHQSQEEMTPPLPPTTTHPLFKATNSTPNINYVASTLDPPKAAYYPVTSSASQQSKNFLPANPWEREEREKENELRREHIRQWRDQQIAELSALPQRTPQQEEQLKTLVLERDFERRAQEVEDQEDDSEATYSKDNVHEVIRLANQTSTVQAPTTNYRQVDHRVTVTTQNVITPPEDGGSSCITTMADPQQSYQSYPIQQSQIVPTPTVQPKSILKHNRYDTSTNTMPSSPSKSHKTASFADDHRIQTEHSINQISKEMSGMNLNPEPVESQMQQKFSTNIPDNNTGSTGSVTKELPEQIPIGANVPPPPPPERNSSYLVMSQQQQKFRNSNSLLKTALPLEPPSLNTPPASTNLLPTGPKRSVANNNINNTSNSNNNNNNIIGTQSPATPQMNSIHGSSNTTLNMIRDNKRVSFHDEENNFVSASEFTPEHADLEIVREDPNRFIQETTAILQTPTTPESEMWNTTVQSTPGVIGAQEVYRDPRQKRLQEQQQKQQQKSTEAGVPEKLSFKEKMKMFALESGENQTPKDKLKISRAQRDIDAVH